MKKIEKITGGTIYPNQTNDLIDNTEELDKRVLANKESIENLDCKIIKNSNDISKNYTALNNKINNLQTGGSGGTGGSSGSDNSYMDFELLPWAKEVLPKIEANGVLRIQGGIFQLYVEVNFNGEPIFVDNNGYIVKIVDKDNYIKNILLSESENNMGYAITSGVISFYYYTVGKEESIKSYTCYMLPGFYGTEELGIYFFNLDEFNEGSDMKSFTYSASGFIGDIKI